MNQIIPKIDEGQMQFFNETLDATLESIMAYRNSAVGIIDALSQNAKQDTENMESAMGMINDPEQMEKLGKLLKFAGEIKN